MGRWHFFLIHYHPITIPQNGLDIFPVLVSQQSFSCSWN